MDDCVRLLICPVCGERLARAGRALTCPHSHSFDTSREGYVNLLLGGWKRRKAQGDTREMLRSRRRFVDRGHYEPLSDAINQCVSHHLESRTRQAPILGIAEVGCGEGYFIGRLQDQLSGQREHTNPCFYGMDISKHAVRLAARRYPRVHFCVGDVWRRVLFARGSIDVLLDILAPRNAEEFHRVVTQDGVLMVVIPGPDHLSRLRAELGLLQIEAHKRERVIEQLGGVFDLQAEHTVRFEIPLVGEDLYHLVRMTPNYWHIPDAKWQGLKSAGPIIAGASFVLLQFGR
jgi:23S rRNA (guanine745-N1)-methyltransferase